MSFFRSPALRRLIYVLAAALALVRLAHRSHAEPLMQDPPAPAAIVSAHLADEHQPALLDEAVHQAAR